MNSRIKKIILTSLFSIIGTFLFGQRFLPTTDTYIEQSNPTVVENTTNSGKLVVRNYSSSERITFLEFNVGDFNEQVSKAELCLYFYAVTNSGTETVDVYEVTSGTISNNITWTNFTGNYTLASTPITSLDIPSTTIASWCKFDIKNLVNTVSATTGTNKKIRLALKARTTTLLLNFYSTDNTTYPFYSPFLVMTPALTTNLVEKSRITVNQDGWVTNVNPDNLYDEQRLLIAYYKNGTTKQYKYSNLRFDIPSVLSDNDKVILKTKVKADQSGTYINYLVDLLGMPNLDDAVNVNNLTWNTMPLTGNYTYLRSKFYSLTDKANETVVDWDVTDYVKAQKSAGKAKINFTFQVPELGVAQGDQLAFYSLNYLSVDPTSTNIPQLIIYEPNIPTIASFTPSSSGAGTTVTITGTNFTGTTDVSFGGTPATSFTVVNATTITAIIGSGSSGSVSVTTSGGTATKTGFTWLEPVTIISSLQNATALPLSASSVISVTNGGSLNIDTNTTVNSITIESGGKVTNSSSLVTSSLVIESDAAGTGTYVDNGSSTITTASVKQYLTNGRNWYISIPVTTSNISAFSSASSLVRYYEPTATWYTQTIDSIISPMKGYISVNTNSTGTITFTGTLNTGTKSIELTRTTGVTKEGFNLVGNPYPSYLSWSAVAADNAAANMPTGTMWYRTVNYNGKSAWAPNTAYSLNDIIYNGTRFYKVTTAGTSAASGGPTGGLTGITDGSVVWNYEGSIYIFATISATGVATPTTVNNLVPPMQAFWVKSTGGTLTFKNTMRSHNTGGSNMLKAPKNSFTEMPLVRLSVSNGVSADEAVIYANADAANGFDTYDAPKYFNTASNQPEIYSKVGNEKLVINAMNEISADTEISLGFATEKGNDFTIAASELKNLDTDTKVILKDKQTSTELDLTTGQPYAFSSDATTESNRFSLIFRTSGSTTGTANTPKQETQVFVNSQNKITIIARQNSKYIIYNAVGQLIENGSLNSELRTQNTKLAAGVYVVKVNNQSIRVIVK